MFNSKPFRRVLVSACASLALLVPSTASYAAATSNDTSVASESTLLDDRMNFAQEYWSGEKKLTDKQFDQGFAELEASAIPREYNKVDGVVNSITYDLGSGLKMTVGKQEQRSDAGKRLGGGTTRRHGTWYITFNTFEQNLLLGGGAWGLGLAICAIPFVGQVACTVVGVILVIATAAVSTWGLCPSGMPLAVYNPSASDRAWCTWDPAGKNF